LTVAKRRNQLKSRARTSDRETGEKSSHRSLSPTNKKGQGTIQAAGRKGNWATRIEHGGRATGRAGIALTQKATRATRPTGKSVTEGGGTLAALPRVHGRASPNPGGGPFVGQGRGFQRTKGRAPRSGEAGPASYGRAAGGTSRRDCPLKLGPPGGQRLPAGPRGGGTRGEATRAPPPRFRAGPGRSLCALRPGGPTATGV